MANVALIQEKLPQELWKKAEEFTIPDMFLVNSADLIILILNSKSIDNKEEKQSWFDLLPLMTQEQIDKLRDILVREKQKLEEIEKKYEQKKSDIKTQYVQKRQEEWYKNKMVQIKQKEAASQEKQTQEADSLLTQI